MVKAYVHASEVITGKGIAQKDGVRPKDTDLDRIADGAVVFSTKKVKGKEVPQKIEWVGATSKLPKKFRRARKTDLKGKKAVVPGLIDCHTHMVFAGDRSDEFAQRCSGVSYEEIAKKGGGILTTVQSTRRSTERELERLTTQRLKEAMGRGVRTLEIKSGYGLSYDSELKSLKVIQNLKKKFPEVTIQSTFLGAHALPHDKPRNDYIDEVIDKMLPDVAKNQLADTCDVFVDRGYYTLDEGKRILQKAKQLGLKIKIHADELANTESAELAAQLGALSADHLLKISDRGIDALANSDTVGVVLPGTAFYLKADYAPAKKMIDAGVRVALSTDCNPGSCMCNNLPAIMTLSALYMGLSCSEILAGVTYNAARALGMHESKGTIEVGKDADLTVLPFAKFEQTYYQFAW